MPGSHTRPNRDQDDGAGDQAADGAFARLLRAERQRQRRAAERPARVVLRGVAADLREKQRHQRRRAVDLAHQRHRGDAHAEVDDREQHGGRHGRGLLRHAPTQHQRPADSHAR